MLSINSKCSWEDCLQTNKVSFEERTAAPPIFKQGAFYLLVFIFRWRSLSGVSLLGQALSHSLSKKGNEKNATPVALLWFILLQCNFPAQQFLLFLPLSSTTFWKFQCQLPQLTGVKRKLLALASFGFHLQERGMLELVLAWGEMPAVM